MGFGVSSDKRFSSPFGNLMAVAHGPLSSNIDPWPCCVIDFK